MKVVEEYILVNFEFLREKPRERKQISDSTPTRGSEAEARGGAEAQGGPAAHVSPSGLLLLHEAATEAALLGQRPGRPLSGPGAHGAAGRPQPPLPDSNTELHSSVVALRGVCFRPELSPGFFADSWPRTPPPAAFPFTFCNGSSRVMELKAGRQANGRHHFGRRDARKRRALIGCVGMRGGATATGCFPGGFRSPRLSLLCSAWIRPHWK